MDTKFKSFIIQLLRKGTFLWKPRQEALKNSRIAPSTHLCAICGKYVYTGKKTLEKINMDVPEGVELIKGKICIDHIDPIVDPTTGFTTWDDYINRMYCSVEGFQALCCDCHDGKSAEERELRKKYRKKVK